MRFKAVERTLTSWPGPPRPGPCPQPGALREPGGDLLQGKGGRRIYVLHGPGPAGYRSGRLADEEKGVPAYEVLETFKGTELEYREYEPLFACAGEAAAKQRKKAHYVVCDGYVTMSDGTGIVHIAPAFGEGRRTGRQKVRPPFVQFVDGKGNMTEGNSLRGHVCEGCGQAHPDGPGERGASSTTRPNSSMNIPTAGGATRP